MIIQKLELHGFKSFPDRTKVIFHPGITTIIGPNGTGKSNIVDAILWVMGGTKLRTLRGEKSEDVIFHGNQNRPPLGMADVTLSLAEDEEKVLINHRLFRSGESEYRLNGKIARLKDIQEILWKKSIGEREYFIIEQGNIDHILTSKPQEKRQLLEEAAGTAYYRDKKRQAQTKLENSEQNLIRLEDIISEVSRAKNSLKRQANAAVKYRKLREEIRRLTLLSYRQKIDLLEKSKAEISLHFNQILEKERALSSRIKQEEKELTQKFRDVWNIEKSIKEQNERLFSLKSEIARVEAERENNNKSIGFYEQKQREAEKNSDELAKEIKSLDEELQSSKSQLAELTGSFRKKQSVLKRAEEEARETLGKRTEREKGVESLQAAHLQSLSSLLETRNELTKIEKELELITYQEKKLQSQLERNQSLLEDADRELGEIKERLSQSEKTIESKNSRLEEIKKAEDKLQAARESLSGKISGLKEAHERNLHHLHLLRQLEEKEFEAKSSQKIPGAIGFLADLVETDPQDTPLVDIFWKEEARSTLLPAQDFLKHIGTMTSRGTFFLINEERKKYPSREVLNQPGTLGLLTSRIRPKPGLEKYLPYLKEAVIVEDIKAAVEVWLRFPDFNFVTLQADVLYSSGFMKLGRKEEGIIALRQEIKRLEEEVARGDKQLAPLVQELRENEDKLKKLGEETAQESRLKGEEEKYLISVEKQKAVKEAEREKIFQTVSLLGEELSSLKSDQETLSQRREEFRTIQKQREADEKRAKSEIETLQHELALHQEKNTQSGRHFYELKAELDLFEEKIRSLEFQVRSLTKQREQILEQSRSLKQEVQSCIKEGSGLKELNFNLEEKRSKLQKERSEIEDTVARDEALLHREKNELGEREKQIQDLQAEYETTKEERVKWEISKAEKERDLANLDERCWQELKKTLKEIKDEISDTHLEEAKVEEKLEEFQERLQKLREVNLMAEEEYLTQKKRHEFLLEQKNDLRSSIDTTQEAIKKIDEESKVQFLKAFNEVNIKFQEVFTLLFKGGKTELLLTNPDDPLESGVDILAQPPGKKVQNMMLLSGGEKALTSLAFLFALFRYRPTPFCILDEVDAALDEANLTRFLDLMKNIKGQTQFIIITHNYKTMEVADYIYGSTMPVPNVTNIYSLKLEEKSKIIKLRE